MQTKLKIKKDDLVKVIAGDHKGDQGKVISINRETMRAVVEGVNMITKHRKPSAANPQGGVEKMEGTIHISNLALADKGKASRPAKKSQEGKNTPAKKSKNKEVIK